MTVNIILTGLMGSGKSTIGKILSKMLKGYTFIDIDEVIVDLEGMPIVEIFEKKSEKYFRKIEKQVIQELSEEQDLIIALGGGAYEDKDTRNNLKKTGKTFYLKGSVEELLERIKDDKSRPLLQCDNPKEKLKDLLNIREKNYLKADYIIETDGKTAEEISKEIIELIEEE